jgi:hypothetical protein
LSSCYPAALTTGICLGEEGDSRPWCFYETTMETEDYNNLGIHCPLFSVIIAFNFFIRIFHCVYVIWENQIVIYFENLVVQLVTKDSRLHFIGYFVNFVQVFQTFLEDIEINYLMVEYFNVMLFLSLPVYRY